MEPPQQDSTTISQAHAETSRPEPITRASLPNPVAPEKPRVWTVFLAFVLTLVAGFVVSGIYLAVATIMTGGISGDPRAKIERVVENPNIIIPSFAIMGIVMLSAAAICSWLSPERVGDRLSLHASRLGARGYAAALVLVYGTSMAAGQVLEPFTDTNSKTLKLIDARLRSADGVMFALAVVIIAVVAPIAEEVFFRGYMQTRLHRRWGSAWAIGISALAFGAFHADLVQSPYAIAVGVALGYVTARTGSIRPAIVCHCVNNMIAVMGMRLPESQSDKHTSWPMVAVGIIACVSGASWLRRQEKKANSVGG